MGPPDPGPGVSGPCSFRSRALVCIRDRIVSNRFALDRATLDRLDAVSSRVANFRSATHSETFRRAIRNRSAKSFGCLDWRRAETFLRAFRSRAENFSTRSVELEIISDPLRDCVASCRVCTPRPRTLTRTGSGPPRPAWRAFRAREFPAHETRSVTELGRSVRRLRASSTDCNFCPAFPLTRAGRFDKALHDGTSS